ncbi:RidA family protein [Pedobacter psychrodurus]|uniref:RidA family protein n=1 Tax=Pedobacter psychrodurus TaxID=2530456 RepID=UPI00292EAFDF|nr:RidA family protein [Pedobacter psychrodurus]
MEKQIINPWKWQDQRSYVQAVEVKQVTGTLYVSGQTATSADGISSIADVKTQLVEAIQHLEQVIAQAGYEPKGIVRLNIYTTASAEFSNVLMCFKPGLLNTVLNRPLPFWK